MDAVWASCLLLFEKKNAWANYNVYGFVAGMIVNAAGHPFYCLYLGTHPSLQNYLQQTYGYSYTWYFPGFFTGLAHAVFSFFIVREIRGQLKERKAGRLRAAATF